MTLNLRSCSTIRSHLLTIVFERDDLCFVGFPNAEHTQSTNKTQATVKRSILFNKRRSSAWVDRD